MTLPPKPKPRPRKARLWAHLKAFRRDILSAQPDHLFDAKMAAFKTPFFRSFLINQPDLVDRVLKTDSGDFPKSMRVAQGLRPLLGESVFLTNGDRWKAQRRIIDPAFSSQRVQSVFPGLVGASEAAQARLDVGTHEIEQWASHATADAIFRILFSVPIEDHLAQEVFAAFQTYQRTQPLVNLGAFVPLPAWLPRGLPRGAKAAAAQIRTAIADLVDRRIQEIAAGTAPDDLATNLMTSTDPETGRRFDRAEMIDQVAIFFLAGHETSASSIAWALYLLAAFPEWQDKAAAEARSLQDPISVSDISGARVIRDVYRETLRLYPPVPMMVREAAHETVFRDRKIARKSQIVISPWHIQRHRAHWVDPDGFNPARFSEPENKASIRDAYLPFSAGPRVCPGAGIAMVEGPLFLADFLRNWKVVPVGRAPVPVAHLTVRSKDGIRLSLTPR